MRPSVPCSVDGCPHDAARGGLCWSHVRRKQRGQALSPAIRQRPKTPFERVTEAAIAYVDADADEDFARARDNLRKAVAAYGSTALADLAREGLERAKAQGVHLGRPRKVTQEQAIALVVQQGSISKAAVLLGVSWRTVHRALRMTKPRVLSDGTEAVLSERDA